MTTLLEFSVRGSAVPQPRQRHRWTGAFVQNYTPATAPITGWKALIGQAARAALEGSPAIDVPVVLSVLFLMPRPGRLVWKKRPMPRQFASARPDLDNLVKAVKDALSPKKGGAGAWRDDALVVSYGFVSKAYAGAHWDGESLVQESVETRVVIQAAPEVVPRWEILTNWKGDLPW